MITKTDNEIREIISRLTLEEKALLLTGGPKDMTTAEVKRLGIPAKKMDDGPHGIANADDPVCFPSTCGMAASWDRALVRENGAMLAREAVHQGDQMVLAPGINLKRSILCGRNFEYYSEDPLLTGELASEYVNGLEGEGVGTSIKHFAVNNMETFRLRTSADIDEKTMRELYTRSFEIALRKSRPQSVMCAYNKLNGTWCSENEELLTDLLRRKFGYEGFIVSDWGAVHDAGKACHAGIDLQMPRNGNIVADIQKGLAEGTVSESDIDRALLYILRFLFREKPKKKKYDRVSMHKFTQKAAAETICLLKNEDHILPIPKKTKKIGIVGDLALHPMIGGEGASEVHTREERIDSPMEEIKNAFPDAEIVYVDCLHNNSFPTRMPWPSYSTWFAPLKDCDHVILFAGFPPTYDSENTDKADAHLFPYVEMMMKEIRNKYCPNLTLVMQTGSAVCEGPWTYQPKAVIEMWLAGEGGGKAIADVLSGKKNPSGKLPETFPKVMRTDLNLLESQRSLKYSETWKVGYRYYDLHPEEIWFPFGHGLSYTTFAYDGLSLKEEKDTLDVTFRLQNTGKCKGAEVPQVYVSLENSTDRPVKELKGFDKVVLKKGEIKEVTIRILKKDLMTFDPDLHDWTWNKGEYRILVGSSSQDIRLNGTIRM